MYKLRFFFIGLALFFLAQSCEKEKKQSGLPTDGDGNTYDTVVLGTQVWLTENLKTTTYNDGYPIPLAEENEFWASTGRAAYCWYQNNPDYKDTYGAIYNWYAAQLHEYICPVGYHVPTKEEWETLIEYFNNSSSDVEESFKAIHTGIREWDGSFTQSSYGGWWAYSQLGAFANTAFSGFGYMPANAGFSIRCVKTKQ
jgi:uncharacterized protein (TIGR02145 family)